MKAETLQNLKQTYSKPDKYQPKAAPALNFIDSLQNKGIPLSAIAVNDWSCSPSTIVYVTIPYGSLGNGGKCVKFQQFGERAVNKAVHFWSISTTYAHA